MINLKRNGCDWQPIHLLLGQMGIPDPAADEAIDVDKPPPSGFLFGADELVPQWPRLVPLLRP
jgi:hypothetical protein